MNKNTNKNKEQRTQKRRKPENDNVSLSSVSLLSIQPSSLSECFCLAALQPFFQSAFLSFGMAAFFHFFIFSFFHFCFFAFLYFGVLCLLCLLHFVRFQFSALLWLGVVIQRRHFVGNCGSLLLFSVRVLTQFGNLAI